MGGVIFDEEDQPGFKANSDGDVVLHALCNARPHAGKHRPHPRD
jgi:2C-methyl-D-erythritol 2,4-cyclodiphosphate synthase